MSFRDINSVMFDMTDDYLDMQSDFGVMAIPYSVVIDRFGVITFTHLGSLIDVNDFIVLFDVFSGENYTESILLSEDAYFELPRPETEHLLETVRQEPTCIMDGYAVDDCFRYRLNKQQLYEEADYSSSYGSRRNLRNVCLRLA